MWKLQYVFPCGLRSLKEPLLQTLPVFFPRISLTIITRLNIIKLEQPQRPGEFWIAAVLPVRCKSTYLAFLPPGIALIYVGKALGDVGRTGKMRSAQSSTACIITGIIKGLHYVGARRRLSGIASLGLDLPFIRSQGVGAEWKRGQCREQSATYCRFYHCRCSSQPLTHSAL